MVDGRVGKILYLLEREKVMFCVLYINNVGQ
jgi:hypothetical protein